MYRVEEFLTEEDNDDDFVQNLSEDNEDAAHLD